MANMDGDQRAFMVLPPQPPPDPGKGKADAECDLPGCINKCRKFCWPKTFHAGTYSGWDAGLAIFNAMPSSSFLVVDRADTPAPMRLAKSRARS